MNTVIDLSMVEAFLDPGNFTIDFGKMGFSYTDPFPEAIEIKDTGQVFELLTFYKYGSDRYGVYVYEPASMNGTLLTLHVWCESSDFDKKHILGEN